MCNEQIIDLVDTNRGNGVFIPLCVALNILKRDRWQRRECTASVDVSADQRIELVVDTERQYTDRGDVYAQAARCGPYFNDVKIGMGTL